VGALAYMLLGWCRAAGVEGAQRSSSPPGEARSGPALLGRGRFGLYATRPAPSSGGRGEGVWLLPAGRGPVLAGVPPVWALRPMSSFADEEEGVPPLPAGAWRSPVLAGAPRVRELLPTRRSAGV